SVLKQRHPMVTKGFSATTDQISSSYPKAPGYERGPLSVATLVDLKQLLELHYRPIPHCVDPIVASTLSQRN
ncbi:hypothetical protein ANCDUO_21884, partial [Ancylostoma duodenale]